MPPLPPITALTDSDCDENPKSLAPKSKAMPAKKESDKKSSTDDAATKLKKEPKVAQKKPAKPAKAVHEKAYPCEI